LPDGTIDPNSTNFGLAWYQSDLHADEEGNFTATIKTILLDQIFVFHPDVALSPLNTFHVGFWFNNTKTAVKCGFDSTHPTPFNGEHKAGPVAMISMPYAARVLAVALAYYKLALNFGAGSRLRESLVRRKAMPAQRTELITKDPHILGGTPVFRGTRVPFHALLDYLEGGQTLDDFLEDFPTVTRETVVRALEHAKSLVVSQL
jgi:uncharacterized protein (DUF433 family)